VVVETLDLKEGDHIEIEVAGARHFELKKAPGARELLARIRNIAAVSPPISSSTGWRQMPGAKTFLDTNVLLYLLSGDASKADRAEQLVAAGGIISVQVLNEFAAVASRKLGMSWSEIRDVLGPIRAVCEVEPMSAAIHDRALEIAERYGFSIYDAMIVASALGARCETLHCEDFQDGQVIEKLKIRNPFSSQGRGSSMS
jgi:predicted nucleic acid-binding protein